MFKRLAMVVCGILLLAFLSPTVLASADVTPPQVLSITSDKSTYQVSDTITVRVTASDAESGLSANSATISMYNTQSPYYSITFPLVSFNEQTGVYTFALAINAGITNGHYKIRNLSLSDKCGVTFQSIDGDQLPAFSLTINNPNQTDVTAPTLVSLSFSPTKGLRPGDKMHITAKAYDASGLQDGCIVMGLPTGSRYNNPALLTPTGKDTLEGDFVISSSMKSGIWSPNAIRLSDNVYNMLVLRPNPGDFPSFEVINDSPPKLPPLVTDIQVSSTEVTLGESITFTVTVDPRGNNLNEDTMRLYLSYVQMYDASACHDIPLKKIAEGRYEGVWQTTSLMPFGEYYINWLQAFNTEDYQIPVEMSPSLYHTYEGQTCEQLQQIIVDSMFTGVDKTVLTVGQHFDPLAGITAGGGLEGNLTKAIVVDGTVDTTKPGIYLLRYHVQGTALAMNYSTGKYEPNVYMDFRWVGVSELPAARTPVGEGSAEVLTNDSLQIKLPDSSVRVTVDRNGSPIAYQRTNSVAGLYHAAMSAYAGLNKSMSARVDRQGPTIEYTISGKTPTLQLNIKAKDPSGVRTLKWLSGWVSAADVAGKGATFTGTLPVVANNKYTILTVDGLGNQSVRQIHVQTTPPVTKTPSNRLSGITLSAFALKPAFSAKATSYTVSLGENDAAVTITPAKAYDGAAMTIDGKKVSTKTVKLANGKTATVTIKVTWNKKTTTYKLAVKRAKSSVNTLSALKASAGTWGQPFDPKVSSYKLTLPENVGKVTLRAFRSTALATVTPASKTLLLKNGQTVKATFKVKAQSGAVRTYTVLITRAKSSNANLTSLKVSGAALAPKFSAGVTSYTVTLPANTASAVITAKAADPLSKVTINGTKKNALTVKLAKGKSATVTVTVVSQAGVSKSYTVVVSRQP